ncbi:MAG: ATP-dependent Clp protease ATP-binding subunit [Phycisphaerales bacterium]|nr:ATP-dependent Clp protease ATP-binding subunit [Phycisphaerales bacterium]
MNLTIPVYIEEHKVADDPNPQFRLRPLFFAGPIKGGRQLSAGMSKLAQAVRHELDALAVQPRQDALIRWTFSPALSERKVSFAMQLRRHTAECRFLVVAFEAFDRRLAFTPSLPDLFFEVLRGQDVAERAREVITEHFRKLEREEGEAFTVPAQLTNYTRAWVTTLELDVHPRPSLERPAAANDLLAILSQKTPDGRAELAKVGRCLDWLYPDELDRVVMRDAEVVELTRLLAEPDRRPVLLLGPRKVGKTALVHETVHRRVSQRQGPHGVGTHVAERNVWLVSPARLISGMSYVGQWEGRLLAILTEAAKREHVLYVDDVLGLYQAGQSADSNLNVAAVMRPWVERRDFRLLAEMTPEAFRVLREKDRGFADLFHVLPLRETGEPQTRRILIHVTRALEDRHRCRFNAEVLTTVMDLQQRYVRDQAMPGKAAAFLAQLGLKYRARDVDRPLVLSEFAARSGLTISFLDPSARLERREIVAALAKQIVGQPTALEAMADVVAIAKARLNDPGRPLGTLLFLGPTGVGKTAAAKALVRYLYGDESRLLRFDMNEYLDAGSLARLTGTFTQPDGLLTSAVRRQPYCVLLLDEIEKAHPAVFDLLLQVLGEGRLTDSLGRTSDFTNAVVIMTSNLGTREAAASFGLRPPDASRKEAFLNAAQRFFRPEFFNRIDRLVPFDALGREQVAAIADRLIADLFRREGLVHRRCVLDVHPAAMNRIVDQGYHPDLGARALKRAVERQLTAPIAARLAALTPDAPTVVSIYPSGDGIAPHVQALVNVRPITPRPIEDDANALLDRVEDYVNELEIRTAEAESDSVRVSTDALSPAHFQYFAVREQIQRIDRLIKQFEQSSYSPPNITRRTPRVRTPRRVRILEHATDAYADLLAAGDLHAQLGDLLERARPLGDDPADRLTDLAQECALLDAMASDTSSRLLVWLRPLGGREQSLATTLADAYANLFTHQHSFVATPIKASPGDASTWLLVEMPGAGSILRGEESTHLFYPQHENVLPVQVIIVPLAHDDDAAATARKHTGAREQWRAQVAAGEAAPDSDPQPLGPVVRVYDPAAATLDLRTRLLCPNLPTGEDLRRFVLAALPLPLQLTTET